MKNLTLNQYKAKGNYYYVACFLNELNQITVKYFRTKKARTLFIETI